MAWSLRGTYFENCNCDSICPCTTSGMTAPADNERCNVVLVFHIEAGEIDGLDVSGLCVGMAADTPAVMGQGGWRVGIFMDAGASQEQAEALGAVFGGQRGGTFAGLTPLISEMLGMETAPIDYSDDGLHHRVKIGDLLEMEAVDFVSALGASGEPVKVSGVGFPNDTLTSGRAVTSRMNAFGLQFANDGKNSFSSPFAWSA